MSKASPIYVKYVGNLINGFILQGYNNLTVYPGQFVKVREEDGINYEAALSLIGTGNWFWCDKDGAEIDTPKPLPDEVSAAKKSGALDAANYIPARTYPPHHAENPEYKNVFERMAESAVTSDGIIPQEFPVPTGALTVGGPVPLRSGIMSDSGAVPGEVLTNSTPDGAPVAAASTDAAASAAGSSSAASTPTGTVKPAKSAEAGAESTPATAEATDAATKEKAGKG